MCVSLSMRQEVSFDVQKVSFDIEWVSFADIWRNPATLPKPLLFAMSDPLIRDGGKHNIKMLQRRAFAFMSTGTVCIFYYKYVLYCLLYC